MPDLPLHCCIRDSHAWARHEGGGERKIPHTQQLLHLQTASSRPQTSLLVLHIQAPYLQVSLIHMTTISPAQSIPHVGSLLRAVWFHPLCCFNEHLGPTDAILKQNLDKLISSCASSLILLSWKVTINQFTTGRLACFPRLRGSLENGCHRPSFCST